MSGPEQIFSASVLDILVPDDVFSIPNSLSPDAETWLEKVTALAQRKQAFFDEKLHFLLLIKLEGEPPTSSGSAPLKFLTYLTHLQISLEATYISPVAAPPSPGPQTARLAPAPHSILLGKPPVKSNLKPRPPPIFPPNTPNPTPNASEVDRKYVSSEGVQLHTYIWGETGPDDRKDDFALIWSSAEQAWFAIYRLQVAVAFMRTRVPDPILALTASVTLRDKPLVVTPARKVITDMLTAAGGELTPPPTPSAADSNRRAKPLNSMDGLQEVNLLEALGSGSTFAKDSTESLTLPTTRVASTVRRDAYSLKTLQIELSAPAPVPKANRLGPTLRKSFRKTLGTVSGFRVRMRTVFVPYVFLPGSGEDDDEMRVAGSEERTVVLCVEVENSGESGSGFAVEAVDINVAGEGARARLIGWGDDPHAGSAPASVFPLLLRTLEQYNLLYAVSFVHPSDSTEISLTSHTGSKPPPPPAVDLQRSVAIIVKGRPFEMSSSDLTPEEVSYPTSTFASRWNCILDLSPSNQDRHDHLHTPIEPRDALPTPASPFPSNSPRLQPDRERVYSPRQAPGIAGSKRHTIAALTTRKAPAPIISRFRASVPALISTHSAVDSFYPGTAKFVPNLPSIAVNAPNTFPTSPNTAGLSPQTPFGGSYFAIPPTPAFPSYPAENLAPPTPISQQPISGFSGPGVGQFVEPRRERRVQGGIPPTPGPRAFGSAFAEKMTMLEPYAEPVVVSVALLPPSLRKHGRKPTQTGEADRICPLDVFSLEIFVFNQSPVTRRFEVSFPDRKSRRHAIPSQMPRGRYAETPEMSPYTSIAGQAGIMPLENRIRVGPLRPQTCQSVRMQFLALHSGLHAVDTLTITDTEAEFSLNLRSVMDIVVSDP